MSTITDDEIRERTQAVIDEVGIDAGEVAKLATLPSLEALRGKIVGLLQAPATKLVRLLAEPGAKVARVVAAKGREEGG